MTGNSTATYRNASLLSIVDVEAPRVVTSEELENRIDDVLRRLKLPHGLLQRLAGVRARRMWDHPEDYLQGAAQAGRQALAQAGITPDQVGLLINTSVTRTNLEPAVPVVVHDKMGLPSSAMNFDITNACLGFVNGMGLAATMIDSGQVD